MAKGAYIGVDGVARKIKKGYIGVDGVARKIKKAYIGIGGVARPFWAGGKVTYYGYVTPLSANVSVCPRVPLGDKAFVMGLNNTSTVNVYDSSLTRTDTTLSFAGGDMGGTAVSYAVVGGGYNNGYLNTVNALDYALTRFVPTALSTTMYDCPGDVWSDTHAFIGCGRQNFNLYSNVVNTYDETLTRQNPANASSTHAFGGGGYWGKYGVFAGGIINNSSEKTSNVDLYDENLTLETIYLSSAKSRVSVQGFKNHLIVACGDPLTNVVECFDSDFVRTTLTPTPVAVLSPFIGVLEDYVLISGGYSSNGDITNTVSYDENLIQSTQTSLSTARNGSMDHAVTAGEYLLMVGSHTNTVEAYTLA